MQTITSIESLAELMNKNIHYTELNSLTDIMLNSRKAHDHWTTTSSKVRAKNILVLRELLIQSSQELIDLMQLETGQPRIEALNAEIIPAIEGLTFLANHLTHLLKSRAIKQPLLRNRETWVTYSSLGTVAIISSWNSSFHVPFFQICAAIAAGNTVLFKPHEKALLVGQKIQNLFDNSGLPKALIQSLIGTAEIQEALINAKPDKIFFSGTGEQAKAILAHSSKHLTPIDLQIEKKSSMIILQDAELDFATSSAIWGAYAHSGQKNTSISRLFIHEDIFQSVATLLKEKIAQLRPCGTPNSDYDLGPMTLDQQREEITQQLQNLRNIHSTVLFGGTSTIEQGYLVPTLIIGNPKDPLRDKNESFGPLLLIYPFKTVEDAIQLANEAEQVPAISIITQNITLAETLSKRLKTKHILINQLPHGELKNIEIRDSESQHPLQQYLRVKYLQKQRFPFLTLKPLSGFPYGPYQLKTYHFLLLLYKTHWFEKLRAFPHFLWNLLQFLKREKRL